ncbi:hypothetical protein Pst134EA_011846 [Puccinia striiformis f. sp. tritici]|uniref:hypothetical protein n=1 Tax=Puccinia striiformis f. sp. tritici TaxID=168172 RepID=UPI0020074B2B|nr:hypothetical protein Pst134EA_011846 [Puccinia striiformis f. sp. tritici]KAH9468217.1 hypothetical protein Pst134EA_011846 [Puccinia striiformis f. sp. tritici]
MNTFRNPSPSPARYGSSHARQSSMSDYGMRVGNVTSGKGLGHHFLLRRRQGRLIITSHQFLPASSGLSYSISKNDLAAYSLSTQQRESNLASVRGNPSAELRPSSLAPHVNRRLEKTCPNLPNSQALGSARPVLPPIKTAKVVPSANRVAGRSYAEQHSPVPPNRSYPTAYPESYENSRAISKGTQALPSPDTSLLGSSKVPPSAYSQNYYPEAPCSKPSVKSTHGVMPNLNLSPLQLSSSRGKPDLIPACDLRYRAEPQITHRRSNSSCESNFPPTYPGHRGPDDQLFRSAHPGFESVNVCHPNQDAMVDCAANHLSSIAEKKHGCGFCSQAFARRHDRDRHQRMHTGEKYVMKQLAALIS